MDHKQAEAACLKQERQRIETKAEAHEKQRAAEQQAAAPANDPGQTMNLGQINAALGFTVSADFLASLGINPVRQERAAKLYDAARFPTICRLIQEHLANVMRQGLKLAA